MVYRQDLPLRGFDEDMRAAMKEAITARGITQHSHASPLKLRKMAQAMP